MYVGIERKHVIENASNVMMGVAGVPHKTIYLRNLIENATVSVYTYIYISIFTIIAKWNV